MLFATGLLYAYYIFYVCTCSMYIQYCWFKIKFPTSMYNSKIAVFNCTQQMMLFAIAGGVDIRVLALGCVVQKVWGSIPSLDVHCGMGLGSCPHTHIDHGNP